MTSPSSNGHAPADHRAPAVALEDVQFTYPGTDGGHVALDGVSLAIDPGERVALLGPNGAGKSTLCLHLNGVLRPQQGRVSIGGLPVEGRELIEIRRRVGLVFQDPDDMLFMPTVAEDVGFGPANLGLAAADVQRRVHQALALVGMTEVADRAAHHLSLGQRKRVATAAVLSMHPEVLVLDEPSSNLDPRARRELAEILRGLDLTLLLVTHDLPYALQLCERAVVMDAGRIVADGPITKILGDEDLLAAHDLELPYGFSLSALER